MFDRSVASLREDRHPLAWARPPFDEQLPTGTIEDLLSSRLRAWWREARPAWVSDDWFDAPVRPEVRALMSVVAGPDLVTGLSRVATGPCRSPHENEGAPGDPPLGHAPGWPCACQLVIAAAWEACASWISARSAVATVAVAGPEPVELRTATGQTIVDPAREELAAALSISPVSAHNRIVAARDLIGHPTLRSLVESGGCSAWAARMVVLEVASLTDPHARAVVGDVVGRMQERHRGGRRRWTPAEVRRAVRSARLRVHPDTEEVVRRAAWESRRVEVHHGPDGMALLQAHLDSTVALRLHRRLTALARGLDDPDRTMDQKRADLLADVLLGAGRGAAVCANGDRVAEEDQAGPSPQVDAAAPAIANPGQRPEICVVVGLETLLGLADGVAQVPGLGPIPAGLARDLAADGAWRAWVTDAATGTVVATGSRRYVPGPTLARLVRAREPVCRMPGCRRDALACDLDHTIPWPRGQTSPENLGPLCRRHHQLKTHAGWGLDSCEDGWHWRTPSGVTLHDRRDPPLQ